jgi:hypothetical protein
MTGVPEKLHAALMSGHLEGAALIAAGCVRADSARPSIDGMDGAHAEVTALARLVLRFMGRAQ